MSDREPSEAAPALRELSSSEAEGVEGSIAPSPDRMRRPSRRRVLKVSTMAAALTFVAAAVFLARGVFNSSPRIQTVGTPDAYPASIYPAAASFPSWGLASGCPSLDGLEAPGSDASTATLAVLSQFGLDERTDLHLSDQAYWPVVRETWAGQAPGSLRPVAPGGETQSGPASQSDRAALLTTNCGSPVVGLSWWIARGDPKAAALETQFFFIQRRGTWLLWFTAP